jgi:alpha-amylase/alpha-mannosidase (GH57 family)
LSVRSIVIHGHFYQPPREDPWLNEVLAEPSAAPFHDWNQRIERECYRAVVAARLYAPPPDGRITGIVNTLTSLSFDFGPTLLEWLEREALDTYTAVLEADRESRVRHDGHGNAIAMPYHHTILPLATRRDKVTEVRWGIADFRRRFKRDPVGLWLPETAVDPETLDVLAAEGIAFTILAPHQVARVPAGGLPGSYRTPSGRSIALFVYDGPISHDVAFGPLLKDGARWAERLLAVGPGEPGSRLIAVATDGETFGHHHRFGEVALAWLLRELERQPGVQVENFAAFLARHPPEQDVELVAPTSWSCPHGVERWRGDCGCRIAPERPTQQRWRAPLREGLEWLAAELHARFEREGRELLGDPWAARDAYGAVVGSDEAGNGRFAAAPARARELLELERNALRMFTSCGWFFDDIAGIESVQILRYAARAIELAGADAPRLEAGLLERLARAESNAPGVGSGREVYLERVVKRRVPAPAPSTPAARPSDELELDLLGAVRSLARDQSPSAITAVLKLADRLRGDHREIPFDVQTAFYRIRAAAPPERAAPLAPVARRLGFAEGGGG